MSDAAQIVAEQFNAGLAPDPDLTVSEWADLHRVLDRSASAEHGQWRTKRTPYLREIMDALSPSSPYETVVFQAGTQIGKTEAGNNWIGFIIDYVPGPMLFVQPTLDMAKRTSRQRLAPMIEACPRLKEKVRDPKARDSGNTILSKEFPGGLLVVAGANSAAGLRSMPVRYLFLDEVDAYERDIDGEGDAVELARRRTATFGSAKKVFITSSPTIKGLSRVAMAFEQGDQRQYFVPCPECGDKAPITWARIVWQKEKGEDGKLQHLPDTAALVCENCGSVIPEREKTKMLENGEWVATAEGDGLTASFHLSALYSPLGWYSWAEAVRDFLKAKKGGRETLKTWTNTVLGEVWEEEGEQIPAVVLFERREEYKAELPRGVLVVTAGVDVQKDRFEVGVDGWGRGRERWAIDYRVVYGAPEMAETQAKLDEILLSASWVHELGPRLSIMAACIDSGYMTTEIYNYCKARQRQGIFAVKGVSGEGRPIVAHPSRKKQGISKRPVSLFTVGVDEAKRAVYNALTITEQGPSYYHFPKSENFDLEFFEQLTAEKLETRYVRGFPRREWKKMRPRNEALDASVYSLAALHILDPRWEVYEEWLLELTGEEPQAPQAQQSPRPAPRRRSSHVNKWRR